MNPNMIRTMATLASAALSSSLLSGCGGAPDDGAADEDISAFEEHLSTDNETCGSARADKTYDARFPAEAFTSPADYQTGRNGCRKAYFVDINGYDYVQGRKNVLEWGSNIPATRPACEGASLAMYIFDATDGPNYLCGRGALGVWENGACTFGVVDFSTSDPYYPCLPVEGRDYKLAMQALDKDGNVRKLRIRSHY
jgi:hypothetical protein